MYLHEDKEIFKNIIDQTSDAVGRTSDIVEKDYYVTMILRLLSEALTHVVFKGGTSLSKGYHLINRFSEDVDITFDEHIGEARRKKLKNKILLGISEELNMPISNISSTQSDRDYNAYFFTYDSAWESGDERMPASVKLETALGSYAFPTQKVAIGNYIGDFLESRNHKDFCEKYKLDRFEMQLQAPERTYIDKIFALCDYYMQGKSKRYSRHMYDIYKLTPMMKFGADFDRLYMEVREHRKQMEICPSAQDEVDVPRLIRKWCDEDYYREDYLTVTEYFVSERIEYDDVKKQMMQLADIIEKAETEQTSHI